MRDADVVVLSRFPEIFEGFRRSVDADAPGVDKIAVWDKATPQESIPESAFLDDWVSLFTDKPFHIAANANLGWSFHTETDLVYAGDDTRIIEPDTILQLREWGELYPQFGIISPRIVGDNAERCSAAHRQPFVPFVFVLIKREVIDKIGYLDERFEGYGVEDIDYCYRARKAGFEIAYVNDVWIQHGVGEHKWGSTFKRVKTEEQRIAEDRANWTRFAEKYGWPDDQAKIMAEINRMG